MNNIYKVIWSKAKNCYVVASEIARSHTKSATGSEKIGGVTRRSLLASLMALSLLCGGLGVASAANSTVHVDESASGAAEVYTKTGVDTLLDGKADKTAVEEIKNIVGDVDSGLLKKTADNATGIEVNRTNINALNATVGDDTKGLTKKINDNTAAIAKKADATELGEYAKTADVNAQLANKADTTAVTALGERVGGVEGKVTALENTVGNDTIGLVKDVNDLKTQGITLNNALGNKADQSALVAATDRITTNETNITALQKKTTGLSDDGKSLNGMNRVETDVLKVTGEISNGAGVTTTLEKIAASMDRTDMNKTWIGKLNAKTTNITHDATGTSVDGVTFNAGAVTGVTSINGTKIGVQESGEYIHQDNSIWGNMKKVDTQVKTNADAIAQEKTDREKAIGSLTEGKNYIKKEKNVSDNLVELDKQAKTNADNIQTNANNIKNNKDEIARVNGELVKTNNYFNTELSKTNDYFNTELSKTNNHFNTELGKTNAALQATNKRTAGIGRTDTGVEADNQTVIEGKVHFDQNGNVSGVKDLQTDTIHATGEIISKGLNAGSGEITTTGKVSAGDVSTGTLETTGNAKIGGDLDVKGTLNIKDVTAETIHVSKSEDNADYKSEGSIIGDGGKLSVSNEKTDKRTNITEKSELNVNEKGTVNWATSKDNATGNVTEGRSEVTADNIKNSVMKTEGGKTFGYEENITEAGKVGTATDKDGNRNELTQTATGTENTVTSKDGNKSTTKQEAGSISSTVYGKDGNVKASSEMKEDGSISNNATGDMTNTVGGKLTTTVAGQATEEFKGGLNTTVTGTENHTVNGKQINTIKNGQENIISGGQTNTITGGQINNITGDQTTTITGNKKETVTENVTEDYQKDLTTTVGGNEIHEVKGTKTETVEGKVTENFKNGQETNVTGDQVIKVSGTQITTATDINRNASSGMIDTIDNDYGTNTETKVAGKTTTDVSIKGTGEEGKYIRGANESRDYLIKGTLKNTETKTVEATSTEITDGNGKTSATIQDVNNLAGSVTNGTETGVSGIHANDNSVSIDSIVTDGNKSYSVINQKKGSIQSTVVDGTNSTVILQDKDNVTIASSNGTVGIVGKDIVNNASENITNTAKNITNAATETLTDKVGTNTRVTTSTSITDTVGTTTNRKIEDGKITDTAGDSTVTTEKAKGTTFAKTGSKAYSTKEGAPTDTNIAGNHITTGRVDANELGVSDKDDQGNTADLSVKAGKDGGVKASAADKDGNKTYTKVTATENSFQVQDKDGKIKNHQVNTKDSSENTITNGDKTNTVTSTADGTTFNNSKANTAFEGGKYTDTTIKGNTITTGKVTMDYAEVMKDLGVNRNANIGGKTTTGSLEVKGESKLTGNVTMENNATVGNDLTVKGITNTKTLNVTEDAKVGRNLAVDGNATIAGDVTARSYKVDGKTYIDANGIHANDQKITNVADGSISEGSKDAVNGGQLYTVKNDLEGKVNKVGANAAAMANLHPMEFDPDSKWNIAAAIGNYGSETAAALGAFYRPNDDVMVNLSTAFGTGENMVGGGVSVRLGKGGNKLSREENNALKDQVNDLTARMDALLSVLNPNMSKDFPDVPETHWAYEAVSRLAGNDIVQGYPDGEFHGERTMTRYEMAEIIYNALSRGAEAEKELVEEFKPELQAMAASEKATAERAEG